MASKPIVIRILGDSDDARKALMQTVVSLEVLDKKLDSTGKRLSSASSALLKVGAINAFGGLAGQAVALTAALAPAAGALLALPAAGASAGAVFATVKVATAGMGDAMKAVAEGDAEKLAESLEGLAPAAQEFVKVAGQVNDRFQGMQESVQQALFADLSTDLAALSSATMPALEVGMTRVATALNGIGREIMGVLSTRESVSALTSVFAGTSDVINILRPGVTALVGGLLNLAVVGQDTIARFAEFASNGMQAAGAFMSSAEGARQMADAMDRAGDVLGSLWDISKNLGTALVNIFSAVDSGTMLSNIERITGQFSQWTSSVEGQQALVDLFEALTTMASNLASVLGTVAPIIADLLNTFNNLPEPVKDLIGQFAAWAIILAPVIGFVASLVTGIGGLVTAFGVVAGAIGITIGFFGAIVVAIGIFVAGVIFVAYQVYKNFDAIKTKIGEVVGAVILKFFELKAKAEFYFDVLKTVVAAKIGEAIEFVKGLPQRAFEALGNMGDLLRGSGGRLIQGLINGITDKIGALKNKVREAAQAVKDFWPFSPAKVGPLSGRGDLRLSGESMMKQLASGIGSGLPVLTSAAHGAAGSASQALSTSASVTVDASRFSGSYMASRTPAACGGSSRPVNYSPTLNFTINGADPYAVKKQIEDALERHDEELIRLINQGVSA